MEGRGITSFFYTHGFLCASHPVELLLLCITGTVCLLTLNIYDATHSSDGSFSPAIAKVSLPTSIHVHFSATIYFLALLCLYLQCKKLLHTGSTYLVVIVGIFLVFSGVVYTSIIGNIFGGELSALREAVPFFCLLSDFVTVGALAKFALLSKSYEEAPSKIAHGVATLSPSVTLNTLVGALVIGVGSLSGVEELETASYFGCLALLTHYFMFMTFLPACLSLFLELCTRGQSQPLWLLESSSELSTEEHEQRPNPLLQHVKVIMSAGLMFVHVHSRFMVKTEHGDGSGQNKGDSASSSDLSRFLAVNAEEIVAFVLALLVAAKYLYLEKDEASTLLEAQDLREKPTETSTPSMNTGKDFEEKLLNVRQDTRRKRCATFSCGDERDIEEHMDIIPAINERVGEHLTKSSVQLLHPSKSVEFDSKGIKSSPKRRSFSFNHIHVPRCFKIPEKENSIAVSSSRSDLSIASSPVIMVSRHLFPSDNNHTSKKFDHNVEVKSCRDGVRSIEECKRVMRQPDGIFSLTDEEICTLVEEKIIPFYQLESALKNFQRAVHIRRNITTRKIHRSPDVLSDLPYEHYDYSLVSGACCENVIGYMPIPVGVAGPLLLDGQQYYVPMATTEGCLVASTNRGCRALSGSGVRSSILADGMTRGPVVRFPSAMQASEVKHWLEDEYNFEVMKKAFDSTSRFARLKSIKCAIAGRLLFARFSATTGDAMGMNMVSKGTEQALQELHEEFPCMEVLSLSGNYCSDKKATAINWIEGRGKSVVCEAIVPGHIVTKVLKTTVTALTELNTSKNLVGSAMAGAIGGFNAHAANIVTALFIATGQDPAQNMGSSNCITLLEPCGPNRENLYISCTMPSLEVGTIGGGTLLAAQASCLEMLGVRGACNAEPGQNATKLARITCATVLAGELSLLSALATGQLVQSHLKHNRSTINLCGEEAAKNCAVL